MFQFQVENCHSTQYDERHRDKHSDVHISAEIEFSPALITNQATAHKMSSVISVV